MMRVLLAKWLILTTAIMTASYLVDGIEVAGFFSAIFTAVILGFLNLFLRPVIIILTLPINILSFGLFTFVINALILKMVSGVMFGFHVTGFWPAIWGSIIISLASWLLNSIVYDQGRVSYIDLKKKRNGWWE